MNGPWNDAGRTDEAAVRPLGRDQLAPLESHIGFARKHVMERLQQAVRFMGDTPRATATAALGRGFRDDAAAAVAIEKTRREGVFVWTTFSLLAGLIFTQFGVEAGLLLWVIAGAGLIMLTLQSRRWPVLNAMVAEHAGAIMVAGSKGVFKYDLVQQRMLLLPYERIKGARRTRDADGWNVVIDFNDGADMVFGPIPDDESKDFVAVVDSNGSGATIR